MENQDDKLWKIAEARVGFKKHLTTYLIINAFIWILWFITDHKTSSYGGLNLPWPVWATFGWGIGLAFHYFNVYVNNGVDAIEREYEKLKKSKRE